MISNDVNVIFAYLDAKHQFHLKAGLFVTKNQRRKYVVLSTVMRSFLKTYKDYILFVGDAIVQQVLLCREERKNSPVKNPTAMHITRLVEAGIDSAFDELLSEYNYDKDALESFKDLLLTDFSLPGLYFDDEKIGSFRERFISRSTEFSIDSLNEFLNKFKKLRTMKMGEYKGYSEMLDSLCSMKDYEDRKICAELFCFGKEFEKIQFLTFDNEFYRYVKQNGSEYGVSLMVV